MLSPKAFQYKRFKKNFAFFLYQYWCLKNSKLLIATSVFELIDLHKFGFGSKCIVTSQGFKFLNLINFKNLRLDSSRVKKVLFLSRLHSIKGIYELLEVWKIINPSGWVLNIAGPDECGNLKKINNYIYLHNLQNSINILGPADNALKSKLFSEADLFVLPSYSENFGLVILEALAYGLPVITTKNTPWNSLEEYACGWWIDMNINTLHVTLLTAINLSDKEREEMGIRGLELARKYDLGEVSKILYTNYLALLKKNRCIEIK
jgi:glycosyltransferase involved in cell wall biosynthesis